jgi:glycosyltransferase involved in cell wall biosynthesis
MSIQLSVLLPMYNEEAVLNQTLSKVVGQMESLGESFEVVCIDDGSSDSTPRLLEGARQKDDRISVLRLSRNFGKEAAMAAGLDAARGEAVLLLDADLQHPPELIPEMVRAWKEGAEVVNGMKASRGSEGFVYRIMAGLFNRLMGQASTGGSFRGASDFKLLDRQVVEALKSCPERHRFFRGLVAWVGFTTRDIPFDVQERAGGQTKWSTLGLIRYSLRNILSFSAFPLRVIATAGFCTLLFAAALAGWTLFRYLRGDSLAGFPTVILLQLIFGGLLLTSLGVMSLYLAEMFEEMKRRPVYIYRAGGAGRASSAGSSPTGSSESSVLTGKAPTS